MENKISDKVATWMFWKRRRHLVAILAFLGFFASYILRVNLSVAIVKMTENQTVVDSNGNVTYFREFDWNSKLQGVLLSSFFYGYVCTQIFGGWIASRFGGKRIFGCGIAVTAIFTIVTPPITRLSVYLLIAVRIFEGFCEGVTYPAINALWAEWAPPLERSKLATFAFSGGFIGTVFALPICGLVCERLGWPSVFYSFGIVALLWFICWSLIIKDRPEDDPYISSEELAYIRSSLGTIEKEKISHPWKAMLMSPVVWAIFVAHFTETWGFLTMITQLPVFMSDALGFKLEAAGFLSALPYLAMSSMMWIGGNLADYLRSRNIMSTTYVRKTFNCFAFICQTIFMTSAVYVESPAIAVACITIAVGMGGFAWIGFSVNYLDIAPKHASVLSGIGNTLGCVPGIVSPIITGYIVQNKTAEEWRIVFLIASGLYLIGAVTYGIFTSGEEQSWSVGYKRDPGNHYENPAFELDNTKL